MNKVKFTMKKNEAIKYNKYFFSVNFISNNTLWKVEFVRGKSIIFL